MKGHAQKLATALRTIGKFTIKKKVGEGDKIFGTVTAEEVASTVYQQTSQQLDKKAIDVPAISTLGTFEVGARVRGGVRAPEEQCWGWLGASCARRWSGGPLPVSQLIDSGAASRLRAWFIHQRAQRLCG